MRDTFLKRRNLVLKKLKEIEGIKCNIPQASMFYLFPDVSYFFGKTDGTTKLIA